MTRERVASPGMYWLERQQWIPRARDEVFAFFSDATNLTRITPAWVAFRIIPPSLS